MAAITLDPKAGQGRLCNRFWYGLRRQISIGACYESVDAAGTGKLTVQQRQQQQAQPQGMHGSGRDQQQAVTAGRGPQQEQQKQQKQPPQTTERRVPQQKQLPPAIEGRSG